MFGLRLPELLIIFVVLVLLFGAKKLPDLGDSLGKGLRAFKKAVEHGLGDEDAAPKTSPKSEEQLLQGHDPKSSSPAAGEKAHRGGDGSA